MTVCFKVYLRETGGMRAAAWEKTTTEDQDAARAAFEALLKRRDLDGKGVAAVLSYENHHLAFHRFDRPPGDPDYWRDRLDEIPWRRETVRRGQGNVAGQGRQPKIDPEGGAATTITVRVSERQKETFLRLGGKDWLRGVWDGEKWIAVSHPDNGCAFLRVTGRLDQPARIWPWLERQEQYTDELRAIIGQAVQSALPEPARQPPALVWRAPDFDSWPPTS